MPDLSLRDRAAAISARKHPHELSRLAIIAGATLAALSIGITFAFIRAQATSEQWVEHTIEARRQIEELNATIGGALSGIAVYLVTKSDSELSRYQSAIQTVPQQLANMADFTSDNPIQRHNIDHLQPLVAESLRPPTDGPAGNAPSEAWLRQSVRPIDRLRDILTEMDLEERRLLTLRVTRANVHQRIAELISVLGLAFALSLVILGWRLERQELTREVQLARLLNIGSRISNTSSDFHACLRSCLAEVCATMDWSAAHAHVLREGKLISSGLWHLPPGRDFTALQEIIAGVAIGPGEGLAGRVLATRQPSWLRDVAVEASDPWHQKARAAVHKAGYRGMFAVPVLTPRDVPAVLEFFLEAPVVPEPALLVVLAGIGVQLGQVFERERSEGHRAELMARLQDLNAELEERISVRTAGLEAANRELEAFSYSVAHDLRAPLRAMSGFSEVLLDTYAGKLDAEGRDWLHEISRNAQKMGALIDGLLALARVTRSDLKAAEVDLSAVAREAGAQLEAAEPNRSLAFVVQDHLCAKVDPRLARVMVENLLANAWKFTSKGSAAQIEFGAVTLGGTQAFFVRDNGAGFDMAYAGKLFVPFQRLHTAAEFSGTGIGLATVQSIVRRHGGRIWAEGSIDHGATFYFTLADKTSGATA